MRVLCERILDANGVEAASSAWVHVGGEYVVLEIVISPGRCVWLRMLSDEAGSPGLHASEMFRAIDPAVPSSWVGDIEVGGTVRLAPQRWLTAGFWDRYFDGDAQAVAVFREECDRILGEAGETAGGGGQGRQM